jgi:thiamine biosynthesis lipoprotein ApbE
MRLTYSYEIKKVAEFLLFAADLTIDKLSHVMETIEDMLKDNRNFTQTENDPLTLSKKGLSKIRNIDPALAGESLLHTLKKIDMAIKTGENKDLQMLNQYLQKSLRRTSGKWINVVLRGKTFEEAKRAILDAAIKPLVHAMNNLTPLEKSWERYEERPEPFKGLSPEEYEKHKKEPEFELHDLVK